MRVLTSLSFNADQAVIFGEVASAFVANEFVFNASHAIIESGPNLVCLGDACRTLLLLDCGPI